MPGYSRASIRCRCASAIVCAWVGIRPLEVVADAPGDWAFHCHKSHHTMNAMGHNTHNFIGANLKNLTKAIERSVPDFHPMGSEGMAMMGTMEHPMPDNTLPMM